MEKSPDAFRTISEVSEWLETPAHVLRFWETRFTQLKPVKRAGGRRYYRPADMALLGGIKKLLHDDGLTIRGVQKILREQGVRHVATLGADTVDPPFGAAPFDLPADWQDDTPEAPMHLDAPQIEEPVVSGSNVVQMATPQPAAREPAVEEPSVSPSSEVAAEAAEAAPDYVFTPPPGFEEEWAAILAEEAATRAEQDLWPLAAPQTAEVAPEAGLIDTEDRVAAGAWEPDPFRNAEPRDAAASGTPESLAAWQDLPAQSTTAEPADALPPADLALSDPDLSDARPEPTSGAETARGTALAAKAEGLPALEWVEPDAGRDTPPDTTPPTPRPAAPAIADLFANTPDSPAPLAGLLRQMATADLKRRAPAFAPLYRRLIDLHQKMAASGPRK